MKILYIHQYFNTRNDSGGIRSYEFAKYFIKNGHEVTFITSDRSNDQNNKERVRNYTVDGINVYAIKSEYSNYMSYTRRLWAFFIFMLQSTLLGLKISRDYDIVFATSTPLTVAIPALMIKKIKRIPYVFEVRDLWPEVPIQMGIIKNTLLIKILKIFERCVYKEADHIIALSPGMESGVLETSVSKKKVSMIPNSSDLDLFDPLLVEEEKIMLMKEKYAITNKFVVTHAGSMGVANGLEYIIETARILKGRSEDNIVFCLTGDGKTKPILEKKCAEYDLNNVIFTGSIKKQDMPVILAMSNITVTSFRNLPILATNSPNKFFDSLAAGRPTIVNSNGWTKDIVERYDIGYYVDPQKPEDLANLLIETQKKNGVLQEKGSSARSLAEEKYSRVKLAAQVEQVLSRSCK